MNIENEKYVLHLEILLTFWLWLWNSKLLISGNLQWRAVSSSSVENGYAISRPRLREHLSSRCMCKNFSYTASLNCGSARHVSWSMRVFTWRWRSLIILTVSGVVWGSNGEQCSNQGNFITLIFTHETGNLVLHPEINLQIRTCYVIQMKTP